MQKDSDKIKVIAQKAIDGTYTLVAEEDVQPFVKGDHIALLTEKQLLDLYCSMTVEKIDFTKPVKYKIKELSEKASIKFDKQITGRIYTPDGMKSYAEIFEKDKPCKREVCIRKNGKVAYGIVTQSGEVFSNLPKIIYEGFKLPLVINFRY